MHFTKLQSIYTDGSPLETAEDPAESALNMKAEQFKGALSQLKKEQEEERKQKEEEERLKQEAQLQGQVESEATSQGR